jgi:hypothetical protein
MNEVYELLQGEPGDDSFVFVLQSGSRPVELHFPNDRTSYTPLIRERVEALVGSGNLRVVLQA